jgi:hypothetical protein
MSGENDVEVVVSDFVGKSSKAEEEKNARQLQARKGTTNAQIPVPSLTSALFPKKSLIEK